jgi:hypothetical protein
MKKLITLISLIVSMNAFGQGRFEAVVDKYSDSLVVSISDSMNMGPYEAGEFWLSMNGTDQRKFAKEIGFNLVCDGFPGTKQEYIYGECKLIIPMYLLEPKRDVLIFTRTGLEADRLNRHFKGSGYVAIQREGLILNSLKYSRQFFFEIKESLIRR